MDDEIRMGVFSSPTTRRRRRRTACRRRRRRTGRRICQRRTCWRRTGKQKETEGDETEGQEKDKYILKRNTITYRTFHFKRHISPLKRIRRGRKKATSLKRMRIRLQRAGL